jgi:hypothetical protein
MINRRWSTSLSALSIVVRALTNGVELGGRPPPRRRFQRVVIKPNRSTRQNHSTRARLNRGSAFSASWDGMTTESNGP